MSAGFSDRKRANINGMWTNIGLTGNNLDVMLGDQSTKPLDALFAKSLTTFSLTQVTSESLVSTLYYTFHATSTHNITTTSEILLLDTEADRSFYAEVTAVTTNTITVDRPIDHSFPLTTLGRRVTTEMAVSGTTEPQIYSLRAGVVPVDVTRFLMTITDNASMDDGKFGGLAKLTNGLILRIVNSYQKTIFCFKTNGEIKQFCYDGAYTDATLGPGGSESFAARITFAGQDKHGVVLRIKDDDVIQWVVQDDLSDLVSMKISAQGHDTEGVVNI
jgi:hypothetical protein